MTAKNTFDANCANCHQAGLAKSMVLIRKLETMITLDLTRKKTVMQTEIVNIKKSVNIRLTSH